MRQSTQVVHAAELKSGERRTRLAYGAQDVGQYRQFSANAERTELRQRGQQSMKMLAGDVLNAVRARPWQRRSVYCEFL